MSQDLTDQEIQNALEQCAAEPVHIPGTVQPHACLVAIEPETTRARYVSENINTILPVTADALLGAPVSDHLDRSVWHALSNARALPGFTAKARGLGSYCVHGQMVAISAFQSGDVVVLEMEPEPGMDLGGADSLATLNFLVEELESCTSQSALFETATALFQQLSGYDRVMVYRFDAEWNGEVLAEHTRIGLESYVGLRFPSFDIPAQARAIMGRVPLRFITDVEQGPVPILAADGGAAPLDITLASSRGVSQVHMAYLRNMGSAATLTLSVMVGGQLWGIISFHQSRPRVPAPALRTLLQGVLRAFSSKLQLLIQQERIAMMEKVEGIGDAILGDLDDAAGFSSFARTVQDIVGGCGLVVSQGGRRRQFGKVPAEPLLECLVERAQGADDLESFENLSETFPRFSNALNGCAGAVLFAPVTDRAVLLFRAEHAREVSWAGNPEKTIDNIDGVSRLTPRGSFSTYLEEIHGCCRPWSELDLYFCRRIWSLANSVERRVLITSLNRQQKIMIDELNHRVRNILALIRSVSRQARASSYGSLASYSKSLESRIEALAASHDLASGHMVASVPIIDLITQEFDPFGSARLSRCKISGTAGALRADVAPIFSLVIHELVTNAVKYGALSNEEGQVGITLTQTEHGLEIDWAEKGGPQVTAPRTLGFGSTLISEAIPHELDGRATLSFEAGGVEARLFLPRTQLDPEFQRPDTSNAPQHAQAGHSEQLRALLAGSTCLLVEDNFVIARAMRDQLIELGVANVEIVAQVDDALALLDRLGRQDFAVLDINLGHRGTSIPVAQKLAEKNIPFLFVTGYGDRDSLPPDLRVYAQLTKPVTNAALTAALVEILQGKG